jgi:hypothetical protein
MELCRMRERNLPGLLGHCASDFLDPMSNVHHGRLPGSIQIAAACAVHNPAAFAANCQRILFAKIAGKNGRGVRGRAHIRIVAEGPQTAAFAQVWYAFASLKENS